MSKKKKTSENNGRKFFDFGGGSKEGDLNYLAILKVFGISVVLVAIGFSFYYLERYVNSAPKVVHRVAKLKLDKPEWAGSELLEKIKEAASRDQDFVIDDDLAASVAKNLASVPWLMNVNVRIAGDSIAVTADWRKPAALYKGPDRQVYVATDLAILEYVPLKDLPVIELVGAATGEAPAAGKIWNKPEITAAVEVIRLLDKMDLLTDQNPLMNKLASIDVSNLNGRKSPTLPHILLTTKDGKNINWGAAVGTSQRYVEASDKEKLAMLYEFYKSNKTLEGIKYIELRYPPRSVPQPSVN